MLPCVNRLAPAHVHLQAVQLLASLEPQPVLPGVVVRARPVVAQAERSAPVHLAQLLLVPVVPEDVLLVARAKPLHLVLEAPAPVL